MCIIIKLKHNVAGLPVVTSIQNILCSTRRFSRCHAVKLTDLFRIVVEG